jgi:hypothetical protein
MLYEYFLWTVFFVWVILSKKWTLAKENNFCDDIKPLSLIFRIAFYECFECITLHFGTVLVKGWARISNCPFKNILAR